MHACFKQEVNVMMKTFDPKERYFQHLKGKIFKGEILTYEVISL